MTAAAVFADDPSRTSLLELRSAQRQLRKDAGYFYDARLRDDRPHFVLQLTLSGSGYYEDQSGRHSLPAGWAFARIIPGAFSYGYDSVADRPYDLVYLSLGNALHWQRRIARDFGVLLNLSGADAVRQQILELADAFRADALPNLYLTSARIYQLLMTIYSELCRRRVEQRPRVERAIDAVSRRAGDPHFGVAELAETLNCSREHLAREFRATTGRTIGQHLLQHRLRLAARELREGDRKLEAVARAAGFSGANYFCRVFRKHAGVSPGEFRRKSWQRVGFASVRESRR